MVRNDNDQYVRLRDDVYRSLIYMLSETAVGVSGNPAVEPKKKTTYVNEILMNALACPVTKHFVFSENVQGEIEELAFKPGDRITICRAGTVGHYPPKDRIAEPASEPLPRSKQQEE